MENDGTMATHIGGRWAAAFRNRQGAEGTA